ncbi:hypothetical protein EDM22_10490 [Agromyces tardus]|uniref:Uncharacterized protein n=1 Tax=Agromyces tardus TaxID=2583849 RepID=A0A3M8AC05_9MICO|nr:hypothetical protein EDM22_10490 [Agromyces tardus]
MLPGAPLDEHAIDLLREQLAALDRLRIGVLDELPALAPPDVIREWRSSAADRCSERIRELNADAHWIGEHLHDAALALRHRIDEVEAQLAERRAAAALAAASVATPPSEGWRWTTG